MKILAMFLLVAAVVMSSSGELSGNPDEPRGLYKRYINCSPRALCLPATEPPVITPELHPDIVDGNCVPIDPTVKNPLGHRQKSGSKPVPIIVCNRTGKCQRI